MFHLSSSSSLQVLSSALAVRIILLSVVVGVASKTFNLLLAVLLASLAGVYYIGVSNCLLHSFIHSFIYLEWEREGVLLGLDRFALWPWILCEVSSLPSRSSCMSFEITDRSPAEFILTIIFIVIFLVESGINVSVYFQKVLCFYSVVCPSTFPSLYPKSQSRITRHDVATLQNSGWRLLCHVPWKTRPISMFVVSGQSSRVVFWFSRVVKCLLLCGPNCGTLGAGWHSLLCANLGFHCSNNRYICGLLQADCWLFYLRPCLSV
jgi:hypothetical protein